MIALMRTRIAVAVWSGLILVLSWAYALHAGEYAIHYSGSLGQSQPDDEPALELTEASGLAALSDGSVWTVQGNTLYGFWLNPDGRVSFQPYGLARGFSLAFAADDRLCLWDRQSVYHVELIGETAQLQMLFTSMDCDSSFPATAGSLIAAAPPECHVGFAQTARFFTLVNRTEIRGFDAEGQDLGILLTLPEPSYQSRYAGIAIEPVSGDLLAGTFYREDTVRRFRPDGSELRTGTWPRSGVSLRRLETANGMVWSLVNGAQSLTAPSILDNVALQSDFARLSTGLCVVPDGAYWLATAQGIYRFNPQMEKAHARLGGMPELSSLAVMPSGELIGAQAKGNRLYRLWGDDAPDALLRCNDDEPWRIGGGWKGHAAALAAGAGACLVLDDAQNKLWAWQTRREDRHRPEWVEVALPEGLVAPRALAADGWRFWILDGNRLITGGWPGLASGGEIPAPDGTEWRQCHAIAAAGSLLFTVAASDITAWRMQEGATLTLAWKKTLPSRPSQIAADGNNLIAVFANEGNDVIGLDSMNGAERTRVSLNEAQEPAAIGGIAIRGAWLYVSDDTRHRIIRYALCLPNR